MADIVNSRLWLRDSLLVFGLVLVSGGLVRGSDVTLDETVRRWLSPQPKLTSGLDIKCVTWAGDAVGVAIARALEDLRPVDEKTAGGIVTLVEMAFSDIRAVQDPGDRNPAVCLLVLRSLSVGAYGQEVTGRIVRATEKLSEIQRNRHPK